MSLTLQNDVARRLRRGGSRQATTASALFGRSCRLLEAATTPESAADGDRDRRFFPTLSGTLGIGAEPFQAGIPMPPPLTRPHDISEA
jgi:hypothetical protein